MVAGLSAPEQKRMLADYAVEREHNCLRSARYTAATGVVTLLLFTPFDFARPDWAFSMALTTRLVACLVSLVIGLVLLTPIGRKYPNCFGFALLMVPILMLMMMMALTGLHHSSYFSGLPIVMVASGLVMIWEPAWTAALGLMVIGCYAFATILDSDPVTMRFVENLSSLVASGGLAVVTSVMRGRLDQHEFERRWRVAEAYHHKSDFFANLSHELRTPVHVILGYTDMLLDPDSVDAEERQALLEMIRSQGVNLHRLLSDLLDAAKVEAGKMEIQESEVAVGRLVEDVVNGFQPMAASKDLELSITSSPMLPEIVSDEGKLRQILTNVVGNALKFTERGSIRVLVAPRSEVDGAILTDLVILRDSTTGTTEDVEWSSDGIAILVSDTGAGIASSELVTLATEFHQAGSSTVSEHRGTGLGLSLSRKLLELLGGHLGVCSAVGRGTTFALLLPRRPGAEPPAVWVADKSSDRPPIAYAVAAVHKRA